MKKHLSWNIKSKLLSPRIFFISFTVYLICFISCVYTEERSVEINAISLAKIIFFNQIYMDKMSFAGKSGNWKLADFYHHGMEENMEEWLEGNVMILLIPAT